MKYFDWSNEKNEWLKKERDISFEEVLISIVSGDLLDIMEHKNKERYPNQKVFVVKVNSYAYRVPFVEDGERIFLKTEYPSRQATKEYISGEKEE